MHTEPRDDSYDAVVIGSGLGGLTAAALLAKAGWKTLVAEQASGPGGYARAFRRGAYIFDPAVHATAQGADGLLPDLLYRHLGVRDRIAMVQVNSLYEAAFPDLRLRVPFGAEEYVAAHARAMPHEREAFERFVALSLQVHEEAHALPPQLSMRDLDAAVARFPTLFRYLGATFAEVTDDVFTDPKAKALAAAMWPYLGLPPSRLAFVAASQVLGVHVQGAYYCLGSFDTLVQALVVALEANGGELVVDQPVTGISVEDGRASGVTLESGHHVRAPVVISNADARATLLDYVGAERLPAPFVKRLRRMEPALSAFVVFAATTLDLSGAAHETFLFRHWDHDRAYEDLLAGRPGGTWGNVPTVTDPSLAPPGEHLVILSALAPYQLDRPWDTLKEQFTAAMLDEFDTVYPGLKDNLTYCESATPDTLHRFTLNHQGAAYGWANTPRQQGSKRLSHATPINDLYLCGHWTQPGTGSIRVLVSGVHTAFMVMARAGVALPDLNPPDALAPGW
jgi:prolycopene isomerase